MSQALAEYLSALEARDTRERAHEEYINAYTKLADRTAKLNKTSSGPEDDITPTGSTKTIRPATPKGKASCASETTTPSNLAQIRSELASSHKTRTDLEAKLSSLTIELAAFKTSDKTQRQRIDQLEKVRANLERRGKDRVDELKGKGKFVEDIQDEMVALTLELNMAEQDKEKLRKENEELTRRWMKKMEEEADKMNDTMGWEKSGKR